MVSPAKLPANRYTNLMHLIEPRSDLSAIPASEQFGFRYGSKGTHTSRTIMLEELLQILAAVPASGFRDDYVSSIIDHNVTGKKTVATRRHTIQRLSELYGLDPSLLLFRVLRRFWDAESAGRPLLALSCALARDPLLRLTGPIVLAMKPREELSRHQMVSAIQQGTGERLNGESIEKVVRNCSSSWTQSRHLHGRVRKIRQRVEPTPLSTAYALLLGYLEGVRGTQLFRTSWAQVLDSTPEHLVDLAKDAKRLGVLDLKQAGKIVEIGFSSLLTRDEIRDSHGEN